LRRKRPGEGSGAASATAMDEETKKKVEATVLDILREFFTEDKVRDTASERLGIDLSAPDLKPFIRGVLEGYLRSFLSQNDEKQDAEKKEGAGVEGEVEPEEKNDEEEKGGSGGKMERDGTGNLILCRVSFPFSASNSELGRFSLALCSIRSIPFSLGC
jgi:hypothetical protein